MTIVRVGFDPDCKFAATPDVLQTEGLANCIAVVAWDSAKSGAVMRHYDTLRAYTNLEPDPPSKGQAFVFNDSKFDDLKAQMNTFLLDNLARSGIKTADTKINYTIGLGNIWFDKESTEPLWKSRYNLIVSLNKTFGVEPSVAGSTLNFIVRSATMNKVQ